ncbi:hypothetical protein BIW11_01953 [Tropilaelaps mercedesae]|uniref:Uncharacterized protein n=1 Tax=Tropilaelaps mercedesae TaxID=418985 RepID=A0A1V9X5F6_9ACAR|nr:hypothetical protein BIW11_01953 [Tropilaelaps mercedesae]
MMSSFTRTSLVIQCLFVFFRSSPIAVEAQGVSRAVNASPHTMKNAAQPSATARLLWSPIYQLNQMTRPRRDRLPPGFEVRRITPSEDGRKKFPPAVSAGLEPFPLITKLLGSPAGIHLNTPYYYPESATVVFPGGVEHGPHDSPIYPVVISSASYPPYVPYPAYPDVVYPVYPTGGGVQPEHKVGVESQQPGSGGNTNDERIVCQEHVKRVRDLVKELGLGAASQSQFL